MIKICLVGALGQMGRTFSNYLANDNNHSIVCGVDKMSSQTLPYPIYSTFNDCPKVDVVVDFSSPSVVFDMLNYCLQEKCKCVIASTGHDENQLQQICNSSRQIAIFKSANMSLGINVLLSLVAQTQQALSSDWDVEIIETHHSQKVDSPSGTAITLANAINEVSASNLTPTFGRFGIDKRQKNQIGIHAVRGGTSVGKHEVLFFGQGEQISLSHTAESKQIYAIGAVKAIDFIMTKDNGYYNMDSLIQSQKLHISVDKSIDDKLKKIAENNATFFVNKYFNQCFNKHK